jgi:hypothetical protein
VLGPAVPAGSALPHGAFIEPTKDAVLKEHAKLTAQRTPENAMDRLLGRPRHLEEA